MTTSVARAPQDAHCRVLHESSDSVDVTGGADMTRLSYRYRGKSSRYCVRCRKKVHGSLGAYFARSQELACGDRQMIRVDVFAYGSCNVT